MTDKSPSARFQRRPASFDGFVHARNAQLVDGSGRELLLRGVGLGNWMLPEGYMWGFGKGAESPRQIEALVTRLIGEESADRFWESFRDSFITEADIERIARSGFDHVRLPINSRVIQDEMGDPIEAGYAMIDRLIGWCRTHRLWVLLDLHGAPGGQTGTNIDDSPHGQPELFMDTRYRDLIRRLWRDLATRYADETVVLGYDLLNEPLPDEWQHTYAVELVELYRDLTRDIRAIDPDHLIVYEGSHWATNWDMFTEVWDGNSLLQFHKYWSSPDRASISRFLETRDQLGLPIYMGEGGENTLEWLYAAFRLYESHNIGWNFWPWKKVETRTSPVSIAAPDGWDLVVASVTDPTAISRDEAQRVFNDLLVAMRIENCTWQRDVIAALLAESPRVVPAWGFGYRGEGESYSSVLAKPIEGIRAHDAVNMRWAWDGNNPANPFEQFDGRDYLPEEELTVELAAGDWLEFEMTEIEGAQVVDQFGTEVPFLVTRTSRGLRVTATAAGSLSRIYPIPATGNW
ncbi:MAG: cellulase family glycosylhydrolase [Terrimesophilobacter sp.]